MKWIRWNSYYWTTRDADGNVPIHFPFYEHTFDCEKDENWREIESGVLDTETGKLRITLKPVEKVPTLREAAAAMAEDFGDLSPQAANVRYNDPVWERCLKSYASLKAALDREASTPANQYTKEAVDELLEAVKKADLDYFNESYWGSIGHTRMARALTALKKQQEAANGG